MKYQDIPTIPTISKKKHHLVIAIDTIELHALVTRQLPVVSQMRCLKAEKGNFWRNHSSWCIWSWCIVFKVCILQYLYMYACLYPCLYIYIHTCMSVYTCMYIYIHYVYVYNVYIDVMCIIAHEWHHGWIWYRFPIESIESIAYLQNQSWNIFNDLQEQVFSAQNCALFSSA